MCMVNIVHQLSTEGVSGFLGARREGRGGEGSAGKNRVGGGRRARGGEGEGGGKSGRTGEAAQGGRGDGGARGEPGGRAGPCFRRSLEERSDERRVREQCPTASGCRKRPPVFRRLCRQGR